jgi:hypothetical protein
MICCSACNAYIENKTNGDIYVIIESNKEYGAKTLASMANESNITKYSIDTLKNSGTFKVPPNEKLMTYSGPGLKPACNLKYLKIVTLDNIIELKTSNDIENAFNKNGVNFTMTVE